MSYQWYKNNKRIGGAKASVYRISKVRSANAGDYTVVIKNTFGSVTSSIATLVVDSSTGIAPRITTQPSDLTVNTDDSATFSVTASGTAPLSYQWRMNSTNIPTGTNSIYAIANVKTTDAGSYSVVVSNPFGSVTSSDATLQVNTPSDGEQDHKSSSKSDSKKSLKKIGLTVGTAQSITLNVLPDSDSQNFRFSFIPIVGLTNTVMVTSRLNGGEWGVLTNIPPPVSASPITISDPISGPGKFYRVQVGP